MSKNLENKIKDLELYIKKLEEHQATSEDAIEKKESFTETIIDAIFEPIMVIKKDFSVSLKNKQVESMMDTSFIADLDNPKCYEISHQRSTPCNGIDHPCPLAEVLKTEKYTTVVHEHCHANGQKHYVELSATPLFDEEKNCIGIIESSKDITPYLEVQDKLRKQKDILHYQANHDTLTKLPNRNLFNDRLTYGLNNAKRHKTKLALLFIDLDHFKEINDSLGHNIGDEVLKEVAKKLQNCTREKDSLARLGGDEFTIILEDLHNSQDASVLAQKVIHSLVEPIKINEHLLYISTSIGISLYPDNGLSTQDLLKYADSAMYKAKNEGRNNFQYYTSEMTDLALQRVLMESELRSSLKNKDFLVYYQIQMDSSKNKIIGMEALVRWNHPAKGIIYPDKFIPLAENTGLIVELDRFVMQTAMTQIAQWYEQGLNPGKLAINLSVIQLQQKDFVPFLINLLEETQCKPQWLELEITESKIMTDPDKAISLLKSITNLGINLAIDDFGTGYSSLSYLKKLPIDKLKIDQSFVHELPNDDEDSAIVRAIIALAKSLSLKIIAEGVETKEQKNMLLTYGCANIQGYFYAKPLPSQEIKTMLKKI